MELKMSRSDVVKFRVNSPDKLRHTRSVAYSVELVVLNKHQISGGLLPNLVRCGKL